MVDNDNDNLNPFGSNDMEPLEGYEKRRSLIGVLAGVIILGCGCIFALAFFYFQPDSQPLLAQYFPSPTATSTATLTPTLTITPTPTNTPSPTPNLTARAYESTATGIATVWNEIVSESFDNNDRLWYIETDDGEYATVDFEVNDGKYRWDATSKQGFIYWVQASPLSLTDFYFSVQATQPGFTTAADYGIYFYEDSAGNYYYFSINNKGFFSFWLKYQGNWTELIDDTQSPAIRPREANKIAVLAEGGQYVFFINDQYVAEYFDDTLTRGWAGMAIEIAEANLNIIFEFDDILLMAPE